MNSTIVRFICFGAGVLERVAPASAGWLLARLFLTPQRLKLRPEEQAVMQESAALPLRFDLQRVFPVHHWGPESGPVVALAHGWSGRAGQMSAFVAPLVARGFRMVAFEAPAHGAADGRTTGLVEFARVLRLVERQFGPIHGVVAHSMGGSASLLAMAQGLGVERLAIIGAPDDPGGYLPMMARQLGFSDPSVTRAQAIIETRFGIGFDRISARATAPAVIAQTLVIHDRRDREVPVSAARRIAAQLPNAQLLETDGLGHVRILKDQGVVDAVTLFIASTGVVRNAEAKVEVAPVE